MESPRHLRPPTERRGLGSLANLYDYRVERTFTPRWDAEFTFVQIGMEDGVSDMADDCGNLSSIVGSVA